MRKAELLAPAGNYEKFETAVAYGADAVYLGGKSFSMRSAADNFTHEEIEKAVAFAHENGKKVFVALNIIARNKDIEALKDEMAFINGTGADALIISDAGLISMAGEYAPDTKIHVSTQANILNTETAKFFASLGADRLILARELSLEEIKEIKSAVPANVEIEVFVHGSMCISYSGRCLLSNYMANRDGNRGECAQPCRWKYSLVEELRPDEYYPIYEDERGSYVFNSKDLCMIEHIAELIEAGIDSFKIEGRMKSVFYTAMTTRSYRKAIDAYYAEGSRAYDPEWLEDLAKTSHRKYTKAFFFDEKPETAQIYDTNMYIRTHSFVGKVLGYDPANGYAKIMQRNPLFKGEGIEVVQPDGCDFTQIAGDMKDGKGDEVLSTPHAQMVYYMKMDQPVKEGALFMKIKSEDK